MLLYTTDHQWVRTLGNNEVLIGFTGYAADSWGDIVFIHLSEVGTEVRQNEKIGEIESSKAISDIVAPLSGKIVARNEELQSKPELRKSDPDGAGWLVRLKINDPSELDGLLLQEEYEDILRSLS